MSRYEFYKIITNKKIVGDSNQIVFACEGSGNIQCFLWTDSHDQPTHIQLLFDEQALEWFKSGQITASKTNRYHNPGTKLGYHKGVRTLEVTAEEAVKQRGMELLASTRFPAPYHHQIMQAFGLES